MRVSLKRFLQTGRFGDLEPGMSMEQVHDLLGEPDAMGGTSRKYPYPDIWLYGAVELYFQQQFPHHFLSVFWDAEEKGAVEATDHCTVEDWDLSPGAALSEVESWLRSMDLAVEEVQAPPQSPFTVLTLFSGVQLTFDEHDRLYSIYTGPLTGQTNRE